MDEPMNAQLLHILQHSLGLDQYGRGTMFRNHFATDEGSIDHPHCMALVALGYMKRRANVEIYGGMDCFAVTAEGKAAVLAQSPTPPKLPQSKQRYQDWLDADSSLSFGEWLKIKARIRRLEREDAL